MVVSLTFCVRSTFMTDTREKILRCAAKLFAEQGAGNVSIAEIAKELKLSEQTVFRHFPATGEARSTKQALLLAIFAEIRTLMIDAASAQAGAKPDQAIGGSLELMRRILLEEEPDLGRTFIIEGPGFNPRSRPIVPESESFNQIVENVIKRGQQQGAFRKDLNIEALRQALHGIVESLLLGWIWAEISPKRFRASYTHTEADAVFRALQEAQSDCQKRLDNLLKLAISPQNSAGELLSDQEFAREKATLTEEICQLERKMTAVDDHAGQWTDAAVRTFTFACYAREHFKNGSAQTRRAILSSLGSNLTLKDQILRISLHKHLIFVQQLRAGVTAPNSPFEPRTFRSTQQKNRALSPVGPKWRRGRDSNPRNPCELNSFRNCPIRPLWHLSIYKIILKLGQKIN